jgi:hypothetical protein
MPHRELLQKECCSAMKSRWLDVVGVTFGVLLAIVIGGYVGFVGLSALFSDLGPGESQLSRDLETVAIFGVGGFTVGLLTRSRWYLAGLVAWGGVLLGLGSLLSGSLQGLWSYGAFSIVCSLGGGYLGFQCTRLIQRLIGRTQAADPRTG